jgi:RNA polymerase sigma-70 factor (family 1)
MAFQINTDELQLVSRISKGDPVSFRKFYERYHQLLATHILRITRSQSHTEEIVQDVFLKIWDNREALETVRDLRSYLFTVSKNHALNALKKIASERDSRVEVDWTFVEKTRGIQEPNDSDYYRLLDEAVDRLPNQQRTVFLMSRHERLTYDEIATRLNLSKETVKKYLQIATESITTYLRKKTPASFPLWILLFCK